VDEADEPAPAGDETRAFQAFYLGETEPARRRSWWKALIARWRRA
jgi:hypothetical protein